MVASLQGSIPRLMRDAGLPGLGIAIVRHGKLAWRQGFGVKDSATKEPVDNDTMFEAASVSKTVFAYAVIKLCEDGVISLDTPLTKYAPTRFLEGDPKLDRITARHVLSHTSGFPDWRSKQSPLSIQFPPGEKFAYSGEGYFYLQSVITHLRGKVDRTRCSKYEADLEVCATDIDETLKQRVLRPFAMEASGYVWRDAFEPHLAKPHDSAGRPIRKGRTSATDAARYASAGGLLTTATDYAKFLLEVVDPKPADAHRLGRASGQEMLRPHIRLPEDGKIDGADAWALGWAIQERPNGNLIIHSGGQSGFRSLAIGSVERKSAFIMLTNGDTGGKVINDPRLLGTLIGILTG
jgi:CubicO group peptidase (beta-lactamase class C family)